MTMSMGYLRCAGGGLDDSYPPQEKGSIVETLGGDEKEQGTFEDPDSTQEAATKWVDRNFLTALPKFKGRVS